MSPTLISTWPKYLDLDIAQNKKCLKNLSTTPQPITQAWELTIPIPWWILDFFHIERGLLITLETQISAHREDEEDNSFFIEIYFRRAVAGTLIPLTIERSSIVLGYLWPNPYYQIPETETARAPSRVSLEQGELPTGFSSPAPSLSPLEELRKVPQPPPELPELPGLPGTIEFNRRVADLRQRIEAQNQQTRELGLTAKQWLDTVLTCVRSGINLDEPAFAEGNITFHQLQNIDRNENPQFYSELSQHADDNYEMSWRIGQPGRGWGGRGRGDPPAYTRPNEDQFTDPVFRARLEWAILQQYKRLTGETPWNANRRGIPREIADTGIAVTPALPPQVNLAWDECPGSPVLTTARVDNRAEHRQNLLDGVADTRTKLLDCFFFLIYILLLLHFLTYIHFLCTL